jgi:hypothetical protein
LSIVGIKIAEHVKIDVDKFRELWQAPGGRLVPRMVEPNPLHDLEHNVQSIRNEIKAASIDVPTIARELAEHVKVDVVQRIDALERDSHPPISFEQLADVVVARMCRVETGFTMQLGDRLTTAIDKAIKERLPDTELFRREMLDVVVKALAHHEHRGKRGSGGKKTGSGR